MKPSVGLRLLSLLIVLSMGNHRMFAQAQWTLDTVISTGTNPWGIAITPDGSKLVVTNNASPGAVRVISTADYAVSTIDVSAVEDYPNGVAITPNGLTALVATTHDVVLIDLSNSTVKTHFAAPCAGTTLYGIAVTPDGQDAIFPDLSSGCTLQGVRIMSATNPSGSTFDQVNTSGQLFAIAITPDSASAVATTFTSDTPKRISLATGSVQNISGFSGSYGIAALHHSKEMLIQGDSLKRVSLATNAATKFLSDIYSTALQGIAVTADDHYAFVVGAFEKVIVDLTRDTVIQTFTAGGTSVAVMPDGSRFFVTDSYNGTTRVYKEVTSTGVDQPDAVANVPSMLKLFPSYPNPFNPTTTIRYGIPHRAHVLLTVYNVLGQEVAILVDADVEAGYHDVMFNAAHLASGAYYYRIQTGNSVQTNSFLLAK